MPKLDWMQQRRLGRPLERGAASAGNERLFAGPERGRDGAGAAPGELSTEILERYDDGVSAHVCMRKVTPDGRWMRTFADASRVNQWQARFRCTGTTAATSWNRQLTTAQTEAPPPTRRHPPQSTLAGCTCV